MGESICGGECHDGDDDGAGGGIYGRGGEGSRGFGMEAGRGGDDGRDGWVACFVSGG